MSYILEALKKSQNERELGQVPTLIAAPSTEAHRVPRGKPWGLVAVSLAALAVAIALYAALHRVEVQSTPPQPEPATSGAPPGDPVAAAPPAIGAEDLRGSPSQVAAVPMAPVQALATPSDTPQTLADQGLDVAGAGPRGLEAPGSSASELQTPTQTVIRGDVPPPAGAGRPPRRAMGRDRLASLADDAESIDAGDGKVNPTEEPAPSNDWMEMDEDIGPADPAEPAEPPPVPARDARPRRTKPPRAALPEPEVAPIPADLRQDVEAFKDELRRERSGGAPRPAAAKAAPEDPTKLRLPLEIESRLPAFFMTAHIYDTDTSKRFVVINALKYTPGDTTREGLKVEDIMPDGVVLSFQGHRFYRRR
jgi:general secretion pathway protein B